VLNALSIDVEEYFQAHAYEKVIARSTWDALPGRVVTNTRRLLALLAEHNTCATFFVLGWVADRHPDLVAPDHSVARFLIERGLAAIYLIGFVVAFEQFPALDLGLGGAPGQRGEHAALDAAPGDPGRRGARPPGRKLVRLVRRLVRRRRARGTRAPAPVPPGREYLDLANQTHFRVYLTSAMTRGGVCR